MSAYTSFSTLATPQNEPIPDKTQVQNNAGGYVYQLDAMKALERFLILGSEGGSYYVTEQKLTKENAIRTIAAIAADGRGAVDRIVDVSDRGRAPKNDPALFALALAASADAPETRAYALAALPRVARIPTHLFHFVAYIKQFRGVGRGLKRALGDWYNSQDVDKLAYQVVKYQQRDGWSNADVLRIAHPKAAHPERNALYSWIVDGPQEKNAARPTITHAFEAAHNSDLHPNDLARLVRQFNLSREMVPTEALTRPDVWEALLEKMPYTAMIRNLGTMSKVGLLKPLSAASRTVADRLTDATALKKQRIHPLTLLVAYKTYAQGHGVKGATTWTPDPRVVEALDAAFSLSFDQLEPTGKRFLFGVDVSSSMNAQMGNIPLTCAEGAAAMALACVRAEKEYYVMGFTSGSSGSYYRQRESGDLSGFVDLGISAKMTLGETLSRTRRSTFGATDCSIPMRWAQANKIDVDAFVVITDNETWHGDIHPSQALKRYRQTSGINAKQIVIGMTSTNFTIADPADPGTLDVVGFDTTVPQVLAEFAS